MNEHIDDWIPELVLGTLDGPTRTMVEVHLESCDRCAAEVVAMGEALSFIPLSLPPERPPRTARTNLLASVVQDQRVREQRPLGDRFGGLIDRLAAFFDMNIERARALAELVSEPAAWSRGPADGINLIHLQGGPRVAGADVGFVIMRPGAIFPHHRHVGGELVLVVEGGFVEDDGTVVRSGESQDLALDTSHSFAALPEGCVLAVVIWDGLDFAEPPG
jgi:anti-sigma factor ChrR (cupin superfamily)